MKRMRKAVGLVLALGAAVVLLLALSVSAGAAEVVDSGYCGGEGDGKNLSWTLDSDGVLTISGTGKMRDYGYGTSPWYSFYLNQNKVKTVTIKKGVTNIGNYAFAGCYNLVCISIPNSVTRIGNWGLEHCHNLKNISLPSSITHIGHTAFANSGLLSLSISGGVVDIGEAAFQGCTALKSIQVADSSQTYSSLNGMLFNKNRTELLYCPARKAGQIIIPGSVTTIGYCAFNEREDLTDVFFDGTETQWESVFINKGNEHLYDGTATIHFKPDPSGKVKVTGIKINTPQGTTVRVGERIQLTATVYPANATDKRVHWVFKDNTENISLNAEGLVFGRVAGKATVYALSADGRVSGSIQIRVVGRDYSQYGYSFEHRDTSFGYTEGYRILPERYLQAGISKAKASVLQQEEWHGSCHGLSVSSILFYKNDLIEERYEGGIYHYPVEFLPPDDNTAGKKKLREMIELIQVSQNLPVYKEERFVHYNPIVYSLYKDNPVILSISASQYNNGNPILDKKGNPTTVGHAVVIYSFEETASSIIFDIYDCSGFIKQMIYNKADNSIRFEYSNPYYNWNVIRGYCLYDVLKTVLNSIKAQNNDAVSLLSLEQEDVFILTPAANLTIQNGSGQTAAIANGELSGTMENIGFSVSNYLAENPTYTIIAPTDEYTVAGVDTLSLANDDISVSIAATGPVTVSADLKTVTAGAGDFSVIYTTYGNDYDTMTLTGTSSGGVTCVLGEDQATVTGADTLTAVATVSEETVSMTVTESGSAKTASFGTAIPDREQTPAPEYDLESGTYEVGQTLTFTKDDDTVVYYSIDGGDEAIYSLPLTIDRSMTVTAHAEKYGYDDSDPVTLTYNLPEVGEPAPSVPAGSYSTPQFVDLSNGDYDADVYYTTDGQDPREDGFLFGSSILLTEDATIKACAVKDGCASDVVTFQYSFTIADGLSLTAAPTDQNGDEISAATLPDLTAVNLMIYRSGGGTETNRFSVAFYDKDGRFLGAGIRQAALQGELETVTVPVTGTYAGAATMKVFLLDEGYRPAGSCAEIAIE